MNLYYRPTFQSGCRIHMPVWPSTQCGCLVWQNPSHTGGIHLGSDISPPLASRIAIKNQKTHIVQSETKLHVHYQCWLLQNSFTLAPLVDTGSDVAPSLELFSEKSFPFGFLSLWFTLLNHHQRIYQTEVTSEFLSWFYFIKIDGIKLWI